MTARKQHDAVKQAGAELRAIVERIERLQEEKKTIGDDIREVFAEAKGNGYDTRALKTIIKRRAQDAGELAAQDAGELAAQDAVLETYMSALGML